MSETAKGSGPPQRHTVHMKPVQVLFDDAYRRAYAKNVGLGEEFAGWESEGVWPEK